MCPTRLGLLAVVVALIGATACTGGGGAVGISPPCAPTPITGISGCVSNTRGGPAVVGATITAAGTSVAATTNAQGVYALSLDPGTYDVVAAKPGMGASKLQGVVVNAGQTTTGNLIMRSVFDPTKPVAAPTISVSGLIPGQVVSGTTVSFIATVAASNPVREIDFRTGNMNTSPQLSVTDTSTAPFSFNSTLLANGPAFVDIITYDFNYNAAEVVINFTVNNPPSGPAPATPTGFTLVAVTFGQSLSLFTTHRAATFSQLAIQQDPALLYVDGQSINLLNAPSDATLFVQASWTSVPTAVGYKIYRSFSAVGPFVLVAQRTPSCVPACVYQDADPSLAPGLPVYYQVSAINAGGESAPTATVSVTPLSAFNLNLASPANNSTGVLIPPTFTWTPTALVGDHQGYDIYVWGVNDANFAWRTTGLAIVDSTSIAYGPIGPFTPAPLQAGKVYQWDIYAAQAQTVYASNSRAVAVANQSAPLTPVFNQPSGSLNGPFKLTTMQ